MWESRHHRTHSVKFMWNIDKRQNCNDGKYISVCPKLGLREMGLDSKFAWGILLSVENVLKLIYGDSYTCKIVKNKKKPILKIIESYTWNGWIMWYVKYSSI